jgi:hypothetical protein
MTRSGSRLCIAGFGDNVGNSRPATAPDPLLDHLVGGGQQRLGGGEAKGFSGPEVVTEKVIRCRLHSVDDRPAWS